jgi:hypothetical protein
MLYSGKRWSTTVRNRWRGFETVTLVKCRTCVTSGTTAHTRLVPWGNHIMIRQVLNCWSRPRLVYPNRARNRNSCKQKVQLHKQWIIRREDAKRQSDEWSFSSQVAVASRCFTISVIWFSSSKVWFRPRYSKVSIKRFKHVGDKKLSKIGMWKLRTLWMVFYWLLMQFNAIQALLLIANAIQCNSSLLK